MRSLRRPRPSHAAVRLPVPARVISARESAPAPQRALAAWPGDWPLACLWSGAPADGPAAPRWTVLAHAGAPRHPRTLDELAAMLTEHSAPPTPPGRIDSGPCTGWIGWLSYDLGRAIEPASASPLAQRGDTWRDDRHWPLACLRRCDALLAYEHSGRAWWLAHAPGARAEHRATQLAEWFAGLCADPYRGPGAARGFTLGPPAHTTLRADFERAVARVIEHLGAGDAYQVNLAHRLTCDFSGSARALFAALAAAALPRHGAYVEHDEVGGGGSGGGRAAVACASPELFLRYDPRTRCLETRPMKGTRPLAAPEAELLESAKDKAELTMIVDLMRNDLGRVAETGSVRVEAARTIERHGAGDSGVLQATGTVAGTLRAGLGVRELLAAAFPPGSVTGAPKVSAMRIIESLEPVRRGPYCGAIGFFGDDGGLNLSVAIRTACIRGSAAAPAHPDAFAHATLDYSVGAGIVADSLPGAEWQETLTKARVLAALAG